MIKQAEMIGRKVRTLDNGKHKPRGSKAEKLSEPQVQSRLIFQVKGDLEAQ